MPEKLVKLDMPFKVALDRAAHIQDPSKAGAKTKRAVKKRKPAKK